MTMAGASQLASQRPNSMLIIFKGPPLDAQVGATFVASSVGVEKKNGNVDSFGFMSGCLRAECDAYMGCNSIFDCFHNRIH